MKSTTLYRARVIADKPRQIPGDGCEGLCWADGNGFLFVPDSSDQLPWDCPPEEFEGYNLSASELEILGKADAEN